MRVSLYDHETGYLLELLGEAKTTTPSRVTVENWRLHNKAKATDGCVVSFSGICTHNHASWAILLGYTKPFEENSNVA